MVDFICSLKRKNIEKRSRKFLDFFGLLGGFRAFYCIFTYPWNLRVLCVADLSTIKCLHFVDNLSNYTVINVKNWIGKKHPSLASVLCKCIIYRVYVVIMVYYYIINNATIIKNSINIRNLSFCLKFPFSYSTN